MIRKTGRGRKAVQGGRGVRGEGLRKREWAAVPWEDFWSRERGK